MKLHLFNLSFVLVYLHLQFSKSIYLPSEVTTKPPYVKTTWRKIALQPQELNQIIMDHNYSRVHIHNQNQPTLNMTHTHSRTPKLYENIDGTEQIRIHQDYQQFKTETTPEHTGQSTVVHATQNVDDFPPFYNQHHYGEDKKESGSQIIERYQTISGQNQQFYQQNRQETGIGSATNQQQNNEHKIDDKISSFQSNYETQPAQNTFGKIVHDKKSPYRVDPGISHLPPQQGEFEVFGFHYPPRPEEIYPFKQPPKAYSNMAFEQCPKNVTGQLVYLWSCSQFLNCWKGRGYVQNCAPGTNFNPETLECDWPNKVNCISGAHNQKVKSEQYRSSSEVVLCTPNYSGLLPHPTDCTKFVNCANGQTYIQDCGPGTAFNPKIQACDHFHNVGCESGKTSHQESTASSNSRPPIDVRRPINGNFQSGNYQSGYTQTGGGYQQTGTQTSVSQQQGSQSTPGQTGHYITRDGKYYQESRQLPTLKDVQTHFTDHQGQFKNDGHYTQFGSHGNNNQQQNCGETNCQPKDNYEHRQCITENSQTSIVKDSEQTVKCPSGFSGLLPHPFICEKFLNCANGRTFIQDCGPGTVFNPKIKVCDWPYNVDCKTQSSGTSNEGKLVPHSAGQNKNFGLQINCPVGYNGLLQHPTNCSNYINCDRNGIVLIKSCPIGLYFNPNTKQCDRNYRCSGGQQSWNVGHQTSNVGFQGSHTSNGQYQTTTIAQTQTQSNIQCPIGQIGFFPHPHNCNSYLSCTRINSAPIILNCPQNTLFNPIRKSCDGSYKCSTINTGNYEGTSHGRYHGTGQSTGTQHHQNGYDSTSNIHSTSHQTSGQNTARGQNHHSTGYGTGGIYHQSTTHGTTSTNHQTTGHITPNHYQGARQDTSGVPHQTGQTAFHHQQTTGYRHDHQQIHPQNNYQNQNHGGQSTTGTNQQNTGYRTSHQQNTGQITTNTNHQTGHQITGQDTSSNHHQITKHSTFTLNTTKLCPIGFIGILSHPEACDKFLNCAENNVIYVQNCPEGTGYNPGTKNCEWNYKCPNLIGSASTITQTVVPSGSREGSYTSHSQTQTVRIECPIGYIGFLSHPQTCESYINCKENNVVYIQTCPQGTGFNPTKKSCEWNYKCSQKSTTAQTEVHQNTGQSYNVNRQNPIIAITANDHPCPIGFFGSMIHPYYCNKYIKCNQNGSISILTCPIGSNFNPNTKICDWNLKCSTSTLHQISDENRQKTGSNIEYNIKCPIGYLGTLPHPYDCNKYISCARINIITIKSCNKGFFYNPGTFLCEINYKCSSEQDSSSPKTNNQNENYDKDIRPTGVPNNHQSNPVNTQINQSQSQDDKFTSQSQRKDQNINQSGRPTQTSINQGFHGSATHEYGQQSGYETKSIIEPVYPVRKGGTKTVGTSIKVHGSQSKTGSGHWPPPFPSTDVTADYYFEETTTPKLGHNIRRKTWKSGSLCPETEFDCSQNECIPLSWTCDGNKDCPNGNDEKNCSMHIELFTVTPNSRLYKHEIEKWLNTDLETCANYCLNSKSFLCKSFNFRKGENVCLLSDTNVGLSGALSSSNQYDYYEITTMSINCTNMYQCSNKKCINFTQVCDGNDDCGNRMDEKLCYAESIGYEIKLAGSELKNEGRIEIKVFNEWGYICDDQFTIRDADVACKELGFPQGALEVKAGSYFARNIKDNETFYLMDDVACLGNETSLRNCDFSGWGTHNCMPQEIVGVVCKTPLEDCPKDHWKCDTTNECLPQQFLCDGIFDCNDHSDEGSQHCEAPIEVRLTNGSNKLEGRVEIRYHGVWGTICDDDFNDQAAKVICRSLGYHGSAVAKKDGAFGPGDGPIWLDQVNCAGNETFIEDCLHWNWGEHNCEHSEDVGVVCSRIDASEFEKKSKLDPMDLDIAKTEEQDSVYPGKCGHRGDDLFFEEENEESDIHFRVVKGSVAKPGEYPWQATIRIKGKTKSSHWCGAVVISNKFVLTAAHCLVGFPKGSYLIRSGDYNVDENEGSEVEAYIEDYYIHERFRQEGHMNNDIALIKLKGSGLKLSKQVQPICLPDEDTNYRAGLNCTISGFGSTESGKSTSSRVLRAGWVTLQQNEICKMETVYGNAITEGMFCAGSLDGIDSCDGDSGGPLVCLDKGLFTLYGITSWGQRCGHANKPGVYVKVAHYKNWIDKIMKESN